MKYERISHPRPDKKRSLWHNLNGEWEFSFDEAVYDKRINIPFSWTCPASGVGEKDKKGVAYYRKEVLYTPCSDRLFLIFGGIDYTAEVYINGKLVGNHSGGYAPFEVEVGQVWHIDRVNEIVVRAEDNDCKSQTYGKQSYGNIRGIWQTVYLEERPSSYIDKFRIKTYVDGTVNINADIIGGYSEFYTEINGVKYKSCDNELEFNIPDAQIWSTDNPYLYECKLVLKNGFTEDSIATYFGIREVGYKKINGKNFITLNNKPIYLSAALDQSFNTEGFFTLPTDDYAHKEILMAKKAGINTIRIHIKPEDPLKLYWADKEGVLIIYDFPCFWGEPTDEAKTAFEKEMYELLDRDINHPSIIYWVIFNESWGLKHFYERNGVKEGVFELETQHWVRDMYRCVKYYDPTRLVEDNSTNLQHHVETDVNTWHLYINGYEAMKAECEWVTRNFYHGSDTNYIRFNRMTDIPVMNSECGNYWGMVPNAGDSDISWQYKYMVNEFRLHDKICGYVFTELKDQENEYNGFYRIDDSQKTFGYDSFNSQMTLKDLHSQDYLGADIPTMTNTRPLQIVDIPLFISSFSDKHHAEEMRVKYDVLFTHICDTKKVDEGEISVIYSEYGTTMLPELKLQMPNEDGIVILNLYLVDSDKNTVMSNYFLFNVEKKTTYKEISFSDIKTTGFEKVILSQHGNKMNAIGEGTIEFTIDKQDKETEIIFEASSRELMLKDEDNTEVDFSKVDLDFMLGYNDERSANPNSFYMTDEHMVESVIKVFIDGTEVNKIILPDSPADSSGCLSWLYQPEDAHVDEAGSYGYICRVNLDSKIHTDKMHIKLVASNGISLFGRKSGKYPLGIIVKNKENL